MRFARFITLPLAVRWARFRLVQQRPSGFPLVKVPDRDPLRVLIVGSGLALGFGVLTQDEALAGQLARELHARLRRGIVVETKASVSIPMRRLVTFLGPNGAHTYAAVVVVPDLAETGVLQPPIRRRDLRALLDHLRATGPTELKVVVTGRPAPTRDGHAVRVAADIIRDANAVLESLVAEEVDVAYANVPPFDSLRAKLPFDVDYYHRAAVGIADALESLMLPSRPDARVD